MVYSVFCGNCFYGYAETLEGAFEIANGELCEIIEMERGEAEDLLCE